MKSYGKIKANDPNFRKFWQGKLKKPYLCVNDGYYY